MFVSVEYSLGIARETSLKRGKFIWHIICLYIVYNIFHESIAYQYTPHTIATPADSLFL
jgi:hypothetical protein